MNCFKRNMQTQKHVQILIDFVFSLALCVSEAPGPVLSVSVNEVLLHRSFSPSPPSLSPNQFRMPLLVALMWREILPQSMWECACIFSFLQICNEKIAEGGGWEESSQRPPTPKVMEAIILPDLGEAGLSQSWRTDNKHAKWFNAPTPPPTLQPTLTPPDPNK